MSSITRTLILACWVISFPVLAQEPAKEPPKPRYCVVVKSYQKKGADFLRWTVPKPFNYVEGTFPPKLKFRWELNAKHIEQIKKENGHVVILKAQYTLEELKDAREQCKAFVEKEEPR